MRATFFKLVAFCSILPATFADYWSVGFYESGDCTGIEPDAFGDSVTYGCTALNSRLSFNSASATVTGNFDVYVYEDSNCGISDGFGWANAGCTQGAWTAFKVVPSGGSPES